MFWNNKVNYQIMNYSMNFINVMIVDDNNKKWRFIGLYGSLEVIKGKIPRTCFEIFLLCHISLGVIFVILMTFFLQMINVEEWIIRLG